MVINQLTNQSISIKILPYQVEERVCGVDDLDLGGRCRMYFPTSGSRPYSNAREKNRDFFKIATEYLKLGIFLN